MNWLIEYLRRPPDEGAEQTDGQLLDLFVRNRDESALDALVRRHATMVWGVCRRVLLTRHDAEDAFQATFLVLVRKASAVPRSGLLGNWLYGVARQTAVRMRALAARRAVRERQVAVMPEPASADEYLWNDLRPVLDGELCRLPDKYRVLLVLCDLEGRSRREVAAQLAIPEGTVASRLATARAMLAKRLSRRGVVVSSTLLGAVLASHATADAVPAAAVASTIRTIAVVGHAAVSPAVATLVTGVTRAMFVSKLKTAAVVVLVVGLAFGVGFGPGLFKGSDAMAQPNTKTTPTDPPAGARELTTRHRFTISLTKVEPWPRVTRGTFLDNERILVQDGTGTLQIRDAKTGKLLKSVALNKQEIGDFRLSPDGKWVAAVTIADTTGTFTIPRPDVTVWDTATWKVRGTVHDRRLLDLAADGRTVLVRGGDGWVRGEQAERVELWDVVEAKRLKTSPFEFKRIDAAALSPDGSLVVVSGLNEIAYWKWREGGNPFDRLKVGRKVDALVFSPDGKLVAEGPDSRVTVEVRDTATLKVAQTVSDPAQPRVPFSVAGMAFADSGRTLVFGNGVGLVETIPVPHRIHFWDVTNGKITRKINLKGGAPYSLDVSPDGKTLAAVTADNGVALRVFDLDPAAPDPNDKDREYREGQEEARGDITRGTLKYKQYGQPSGIDTLLGETLQADYAVALEIVAGDRAAEAVRQRADGYNEVIRAHMTAKGQKDFLAAAEKKARERWDRLTPAERARLSAPGDPLERPVSLGGDKMPLRDALKKIAADAGLDVEFDTDALKKAELDLEEPVAVKLENVPLAKAIGLLVGWNAHPEVLREVRRGKLVLTTLEAWQARTAEKLPEWLKPLYNKGLLAQLDDNDEVVSVTAGAVVTDELLAKLKTLPKLRELHLETTKGVTAAGLAHLAKMSRLETLSLYAISTDGPGLGDDAIRSLVGLKSLRELSIAECGTTDAGAKRLEKLPQLTSLSLRQEGRLTDEALKSIAKLPRLKALALDSYVGTERLGWMRFSAAGIRQLKELKDLESLRLVGQEVPADALVFPKLTALSLGHSAVDDDAAIKISELRELRNLELTYCAIGDAGLKSIATLPELLRLNISSSRITDAGIERFRTHKKLDHVTLRATELTDKALDHLAQIETITRLDLYGSGESGVAPGRSFSVVGLQQLKKLPKLDTLYLTNVDSPAGGYVGLKELKHLRELSLMMTNVTDAELETLEKALPNTRISSATGGGGWMGPKRKR